MNISQSTINDIKNLTIKEKILIVEEIWDSIFLSNEYPEMTNVQTQELEKRIDSCRDNPGRGRLWDDIKEGFSKDK